MAYAQYSANDIKNAIATWGINLDSPEGVQQLAAKIKQYNVDPYAVGAAYGLTPAQTDAHFQYYGSSTPNVVPLTDSQKSRVSALQSQIDFFRQNPPENQVAANRQIATWQKEIDAINQVATGGQGTAATITVKNPSNTDAGLLPNMTNEQVQQALTARRAGRDVVFKTDQGGDVIDSSIANQILDRMIATNSAATPDAIRNVGLSMGLMQTSGNSLTGTISNLVREFGPAAATVLAAGYGLNALSGGGAAAGTTAGTAGAGTVGAGTGAASAADIASAMQIPAGTAAVVGGPALTAGELAALNVGGSIGAGGMLSAAGQAVGATDGLFGTGITVPQALSTGLGLLGSYQQGQAATDAAQQSANAQIEAARIAAEAAKFRPVGVTTRFGQSQFGYDPQGNLTTAGYTLSPELRAQQDTLMGISGQALNQIKNVGEVTAPIGQGAQTLFGLGQGYLSTSPQQQAAKFMADQQALLAPTRERELAALNARLQAQGRLGLATGGTSTGMMAANPELEAFYNAQRMQDLQLASQATQGGQQYATFGAGLLGTGGDLLKSMYGTQQASFVPYQTALGGATTLENLGQTPLDIGTSLGSATTAAAAAGGRSMQQGMLGAAQTMQPANAYSPWGALLTGAGQAIGQYSRPQPAQTTTFAPQANYWSI